MRLSGRFIGFGASALFALSAGWLLRPAHYTQTNLSPLETAIVDSKWQNVTEQLPHIWRAVEVQSNKTSKIMLMLFDQDGACVDIEFFTPHEFSALLQPQGPRI